MEWPLILVCVLAMTDATTSDGEKSLLTDGPTSHQDNKLAADERAAVQALRKPHANVSFDEHGRVVSVRLPDNVTLLDDGFEEYYVKDADLKHLEALTELVHFSVAGCTEVTDSGIKHIRGLHKIRTLDLMCA
jgi:hypothetical protein